LLVELNDIFLSYLRRSFLPRTFLQAPSLTAIIKTPSCQPPASSLYAQYILLTNVPRLIVLHQDNMPDYNDDHQPRSPRSCPESGPSQNAYNHYHGEYTVAYYTISPLSGLAEFANAPKQVLVHRDEIIAIGRRPTGSLPDHRTGSTRRTRARRTTARRRMNLPTRGI